VNREAEGDKIIIATQKRNKSERSSREKARDMGKVILCANVLHERVKEWE